MTTPADQLRALPPDEFDAFVASLTPAEAERLAHDWRTWARADQLLPDGEWRTCVHLGGRGSGKSRTGSEWSHLHADANPGKLGSLTGRTYQDARYVMVEGESGILATQKPWNPVEWEPGKKLLTWANGARAMLYTADKPDTIAGANFAWAWGDEAFLWREVGGLHALDQIAFALRSGGEPHLWLTSTPRPTRRLRDMLQRADVIVRRSSTMDNRHNLAPGVVDELLRRYEGTRLGRQELYAEVLDTVEGALWTLDGIDAHRVDVVPRTLTRVVVAVDPAVTALDESDETGIVVVALADDGEAYVLEDLSGRHPVSDWTRLAVDAYHRHGASRIVAEVNQGGDLVESTIRAVDRSVAYEAVRASRGKATRAEPVAALYEQGRVHHVGVHVELEDQLCSWVPGLASPDRLDALVWGITWLMPSIGRSPSVSWAAAPTLRRPGF
jgi:phage terminase large subunit-like protein